MLSRRRRCPPSWARSPSISFWSPIRSKLEATLRTAFEIARTGRPGPVVVDVPKDVQTWEGEFLGSGTLRYPGIGGACRSSPAQTISAERGGAIFRHAGKAATRPLLYAGRRSHQRRRRHALAQFALAFGIPVVTTLMGIGSFDTTEPLSLRMLGMHGAAFANYAVDDCDFLIAVGARFDDRVAGVPAKFAANAKRIAHLDIDRAEINKVKRVDWSHVGALAEALRALTDYGQSAGFRPDYGALARRSSPR